MSEKWQNMIKKTNNLFILEEFQGKDFSILKCKICMDKGIKITCIANLKKHLETKKHIQNCQIDPKILEQNQEKPKTTDEIRKNLHLSNQNLLIKQISIMKEKPMQINDNNISKLTLNKSINCEDKRLSSLPPPSIKSTNTKERDNKKIEEILKISIKTFEDLKKNSCETTLSILFDLLNKILKEGLDYTQMQINSNNKILNKSHNEIVIESKNSMTTSTELHQKPKNYSNILFEESEQTKTKSKIKEEVHEIHIPEKKNKEIIPLKSIIPNYKKDNESTKIRKINLPTDYIFINETNEKIKKRKADKSLNKLENSVNKKRKRLLPINSNY